MPKTVFHTSLVSKANLCSARDILFLRPNQTGYGSRRYLAGYAEDVERLAEIELPLAKLQQFTRPYKVRGGGKRTRNILQDAETLFCAFPWLTIAAWAMLCLERRRRKTNLS